MKTKQAKEELDKSNEDEISSEPKTRARKKASDVAEEEKNRTTQDEPKTSKEPKKNATKPRAVVKKRPLGIRKTLRSKKVAAVKDKIKTVVKKTVKRGRKAAIKVEPDNSQEKETTSLIPASEIKKEPTDDTTPNSRSSSPKTAGRRQRLSSDIMMMKSVLGDSPSSLVLGPRTSPYSMRSERSNSPSMTDGKNLRSGKPRKAKSNLLNEVVMKEQKKRRLISDTKNIEATDPSDDCKKLKRGRSCSRDGSEISKCSDITESDLSMTESINDSEGKELNKKIDKSKTDLEIDNQNNVQISTIEKVPSLDSKLAETKPEETNCIVNEKTKRKLSLKRSTSLDSDNNNSNRLKLESLNSSDLEDKSSVKTENDTLFAARSSILTSMSKTFNSKEVSKNIRKARRGRKAAASTRPSISPSVKNDSISIANIESSEDKPETLESLSKEINDLINDLDQNIDGDNDSSKYLSKPLGDNNSIATPETPSKDKDTLTSRTNESTPMKIDENDSENIKLHYEDDSVDKPDNCKQEKAYKGPNVSIDLLMDRLKVFEEFDKRRQRQESDSKSNDSITVMVSNDVVLIPKSGADIKLKDIHTVRSPERLFERESVLSSLENNSAISIVKREQVRKSVDIDLPNSVTLIKRNSVSSRKESTSSNHSRESDAISIFEKSLGKDVTLTEIRKSVDKPPAAVDLNQFATLHPNNPNQSIGGVTLDPKQISITPRVMSDQKITNDVEKKRSSRDSLSRKSSESADQDEKMASVEKIKSPIHHVMSEITITPTPIAVKCPEVAQPVETEALPAPLEKVKDIPEETTMTSDVAKIPDTPVLTTLPTEAVTDTDIQAELRKSIDKPPEDTTLPTSKSETESSVEKMDVDVKTDEEPKTNIPDTESDKTESVEAKPVKETKSARNSIESQPGPSNVLHETPESQKRKESVLRTLGLLTHKAAKEVKIEKLKEKERIFNGLGTSKKQASKSGDYTGTLKTVIKLNRGGDKEKKRHRSSLKMTFQKSKHRAGKPAVEPGDLAHDESYYTIERREGGAGATTDDPEVAPEPTEPKETLNLVIPEKASSFSIHPGRLCQDQCFYCGGKFGLFDTPCHIAQMKSSDRQKKVLANEEKLAIDSCLCDACYRHVDRRANCPSYRSRPLTKHLPGAPPPPPMPADQAQADKPPISPPLEEESEEEPGAASSGRAARCHTEGCRAPADHSMRRKWLIKMRASVNNVLKLEGDYPGLHTIPLCGAHWRLLAPLMACALCRRRLTKHHNLHFVHAFQELNPLLKTAGLPVQFSERLVVCKLCRHYCTLLLRPGTQDPFTGSYRRKLLQVYNIEVPPESEPDIDELNINIPEDPNSSVAKKKKVRTKSKQRKSADPEKPDSESSEKTESSPEKDKPNDTEVTEPENETAQGLEEDIESLISSNKIPVPGAKPPDAPQQSDSSEDAVYDFETHALLPVDKQTELQYLLQKQNNPAQFLKTNLTQKQKNITKIQNVGIQKPGQQQRIHDKNAKRLQKLGQSLLQKEKQKEDVEMMDQEKIDNLLMLKMANIPLSDECTIETVANKKPADINTLKNKWQMSESFTQVKKNLSELSKKFTVEKDPKKPSDKNYFNPVKRLETNPSISVRELFPGEEEMNLQCNIEFNNVKGVTPEGWEKCNSVIQYDSETKKLWTELQRPYGNQSSFLRHLILLEKYFRNGDLVLSHNATPHALTYSDSVQSRLRAYDNVPTEVPKRSESSNLIEFRKKPSVNGKSLLKSNQEEKDPKKSMPPPPGVLPKKPSKGKAKPPELIAITPSPQGHKVTPNVLHNIQQLVKGVSASDPTEVAAAPLPLKPDPKPDKPDPPHAPHVPHPPHAPPPEKKEAPKDQPKKQKPTSKPWRPKLMPIIPENLAKIAREPPQVAVDGRHLPSLVQVMSSGKRYHITLQDYNKMCIMRREKLQQLHDGEKKKEDTVITEIQPSAMLGNGGTLVQNKPTEEEKKDMPELNQISSNAANILKNVGLKNITIAPIPPKTATVTSATVGSAAPAPPALLVSTPQKIPNLGPALSITSETIIAPTLTTLPLPILPTLPTMSTLPTPTSALIMPKIPKSLTVIPQGMILHPVVAPGSEPPRP